jgi:acyl-CoA reductase-like NAD-dependent aldehyde dehydrogenase
VDLAALAAWFGATINRGQTCLAARRALVHRSVYDAFADALRALAAAAGPLPLAMEKQARHADRLVSEALAGGARLLVPAPEGNGAPSSFPPTVVLDARPEMSLCREDSFAPVLAVLPYDTLEEAVRVNAECRYGLGASIFTRNPAQAEALAAQLRAGIVSVNEVVVPIGHPATPFGGLGFSGWGVTQGAEGLLEMTVPQVVSVCNGTFRPHYELAAGRQADQEELMRSLLDLEHGPTLGRRWRALVRVVRAMWR